MDSFNLLDSVEGLGEFWFRSEPSYKFPGIFSYCPKEGIKIKFISTTDLEELIKEKSVILGCIKKLGNVTLFPEYVSNYTMTSGSDDIFIKQSGTLSCSMAIFGKHIASDDDLKFNSCTFTLNNLDNFCSRNSLSESYKKDEFLLDVKLDSGLHLKLKRSFSYTPILNKITEALHVNDLDFATELNDAVKGVVEKYKNNSLKYIIIVKIKKVFSVPEFFEKINNTFILFQ